MVPLKLHSKTKLPALQLSRIDGLSTGLYALIVACLLGSTPSHAQSEDADSTMNIEPSSADYSVPASDPSAPEVLDDDTIISRPVEEAPPIAKVFSAAETKKTCAKYQGKLLSVYGDIFKIKNCTRHLVEDQEDIFRLSRQGIPIVSVEATDVAAIPVGETWTTENVTDRTCAFLNKKYVTFSYTDIYYVEGCTRHLIPDYETYLAHFKTHGSANTHVLALTPQEFFNMSLGKDLPSILTKEFSSLYEIAKNVDIIPIDEACKGTEGKFVMFYSRLYKIEKCHKREIDAESYTMHSNLGNTQILELRPEQWVSMPDGRPYPDKKTTKK